MRMQLKTWIFASAATLLANAPVALGQEDCDFAAVYMPWATVNCDYVWENGGGNNFLNYVVKISGTGQRTRGWCEGIIDNVMGECGHPRHDLSYKHDWCNEGSEEMRSYGFNVDTGEEVELSGIELNFHMDKWVAGEDNKVCVANAIRKATCGSVNLDEYECYQRP